MSEQTTEKTRLTLQEALEEFLGSRNVYFQPPEGYKLKYPCITYERSRITKVSADNIAYLKHKEYSLTIMHKDADSTLPDDILDHFKYIDFDRSYKADNLYHDVYTIIW